MSPVNNVYSAPAAGLAHSWKAALWSLALTLPIPFLAEISGLDVAIENFYYDASAHTFPWRHVAWFEAMAHRGLRVTLVTLAILILATLLMAPSRLRGYLPSNWNIRRVLVYLLIALFIGPAVVGLLKGMTARPCPWSLSMYGGTLPYFNLWEDSFFDFAKPGRCFPGAHASAGFALLAFVPLLRGRARWWMAAIALSMGMLMGWSRMMQGAHFLSHNLWSAWLCWAGALLVYAIVKPVSPSVAPPEIVTPETVSNK